ncbi:hypothetical protein [Pseudomonas linyingensis]|uniref:hypothetical protein n=1 Tax=Pseudomonas linyingensis TaxID=915471 RepID=UPI000B7FB20B|nr:hypothetical protein [Pseudomonas linyingensis]
MQTFKYYARLILALPVGIVAWFAAVALSHISISSALGDSLLTEIAIAFMPDLVGAGIGVMATQWMAPRYKTGLALAATGLLFLVTGGMMTLAWYSGALAWPMVFGALGSLIGASIAAYGAVKESRRLAEWTAYRQSLEEQTSQ